MILKTPLTAATLRTSLVLLIRFVAQAGTLFLVAALLGAERFASFAGICALAVLLGSLSTLGTHTMLLRNLSRDQTLRDSFVASALGTTILGGGALLMIYMGLVWVAFPGLAIPVWVILLIGLAETILQPLVMIVASEHQAANRIARSQFILILPLSLRLLSAALIWAIVDPANVLIAYAIAYLAATALSLGIGIQTLSYPWPPMRRWHLQRKEDWKDGSGFALLGFSAKGPSELDKVLAPQLMPLPLAGAYIVASRIVGAATLPITAMMLSVLPRLFKEPTSSGSSRITIAALLTSFAYGTLAGVTLYLLAPLAPKILGHGYEETVTMLYLLALAVPALSLRISASNVLMTLHGPWMRFSIEIVGLFTLALTAAALYRHSGITALPVAYIGSELLMTIIGWSVILVRIQNSNERNVANG